MSETNLKKEFKESDLARIRNIIEKRFGETTKTQTGYSKEKEVHIEGDSWQENGKKWTIKNGLKQTITKYDILKQSIKIPLKCPSCLEHFQLTDLNKKMFHIHGTCFNCVTEMETKLKIEGKFDEYERNLMNKNHNSHLDEFSKALDEYANSTNESFITEDGIKETWLGGGVDHEYIKEMKKQIKEQKEKLI